MILFLYSPAGTRVDLQSALEKVEHYGPGEERDRLVGSDWNVKSLSVYEILEDRCPRVTLRIHVPLSESRLKIPW